MNRRDHLVLLIDAARLSILKLRVTTGTPLPAVLAGLLAWLDRMALRSSERAIDAPWTPPASRRIDEILEQREREP